jgi:hypothetical protein
LRNWEENILLDKITWKYWRSTFKKQVQLVRLLQSRGFWVITVFIDV